MSDTTQTQYTIPSKEAGSYSYTVVAKGDGEKYLNSDPSDAAQFTVGKLATPSGFSLDANYKPAPRITWTEVEGAAGYSVTLTYNGNAGEAQTVESASFGIEAEAYGNYAISVVALAKTDDPLHKNSDAGTANFTYANPVATALTAPEVGKESDGYTLIWDAVDNATSYNVFMGDELVASVPKDALKNIAEEGKPEIWKVYYEAVPKDFDSVGQSVSYKVVAVGDGINFKDSQKSSAVNVSRYNTPSVELEDGYVLKWYPVSDMSYYASADSFDVYCNDEFVETVKANPNQMETTYIIDQEEPGYYLYHIVAKDSKGKHLPSYASKKVIYNYMDDLSTDNNVKFALKYGEDNAITIYLDGSVELKKWYDFEIKIVGSSLQDTSTLVDFPLNVWGATTVYTEEENKELWGPTYAENLHATDGVFKASIIPLDEGLIKVYIGMCNFNADYVLLEVSMKENTELELPEKFPGDEQGDGEKKAEGWLGVNSSTTISYLHGLEYIGAGLDINLQIPGSYRLMLSPADGKLLLSTDVRIGYTFDESEAQQGKCTEIPNDGILVMADIVVPQGAWTIYFLNLTDDPAPVSFTATLTAISGGGGEEETPVLGVGDEGSVRINLASDESYELKLADGVFGTYTLSLLSGDFDPSCVVALYVGNDSFEQIELTFSENYSAEINIPEGTTELILIAIECSAYNVLVTLTSDGGSGSDNVLGVGEDAFILVNILNNEITIVELAADISGEYTISLMNYFFEPTYQIKLTIGTSPTEIMLTSENNWSAKINIPAGTTDITLVGIGCEANYTRVTLLSDEQGGEEQGGDELSLDSSVKLDSVSTTQVKLAEGLASRSYTLTLSSDDVDDLATQMWGAESITVIVGETQYTLKKALDNTYTGTIEIPEGTTYITIKTAPNTVVNVIVTLSVAM